MATGLPTYLKPMLAQTAEPFDSHLFLFEPKWDGFRCLAYLEKQGTRLQSRNGVDLTGHFPELSRLHRQITTTPAILDGEIIVFHEGRELFHLLQQKMRRTPKISPDPRDIPALFIAFDILYRQGKSLLHLPLEERKMLLSQGVTTNEYLLINGYVQEVGLAFFQAAVAQGREGVMGKKLDSPYLPGKRTRLWVKIKPLKTVEAVVIGFIPKSSRTFASLALGQYLMENERLIYVGNVGTGFTEVAMREILASLTPLPPGERPLVQRIPKSLPSVTWVKPEMVVEVGYLEYTPSGNLRHPSYRRIREDLLPKRCLFQGTVQFLPKGGW